MAERGVGAAGSPPAATAGSAPSSTLSRPSVDGGRFPAKRIAGEPVRIEAHCFADGHDQLRVVLQLDARQIRTPRGTRRTCRRRATMSGSPNSRLPRRAAIAATVSAWVDHFESWRKELERREELADIRIALARRRGARARSRRRAPGRTMPPSSPSGPRFCADRAKDESVAAPDAASLKALALDPGAGEPRCAATPIGGSPPTPPSRSPWIANAPRIQQLVRTVSTLRLAGTRAAREFQGRRGAAPLRRRDGLRRALLSAHPAHRPRQPQGRQQCARGEARRCRQPLGHRLRGGRPQGDSAGAGIPGGFQAA